MLKYLYYRFRHWQTSTWFESMHLANTLPLIVFFILATTLFYLGDCMKGAKPMSNIISSFLNVLVSFGVSWVVGNGMPVCLRR